MTHHYAVETKHQAPAWRGTFVYGGAGRDDIAAGDGLSDNETYRQIPVTVSRPVDQRVERWNGSTDPDACTRPATDEEMLAYDREILGLKRRLSKFAFLRLLTPAEYAAMFGSSDPLLHYGVACYEAAPDPFDIDDPLVSIMLDGCVTAGVLTADRRASLWAHMQQDSR